MTKTKYYRCRNARCDLAKKQPRQTIIVCDGKRSHACPLEDPECDRTNLREIDPPSSKFPVKLVAIAVAVLLIVALVVYLWPSPTPPTPPLGVEQLLREVWPWLNATTAP